MGVWSLLVVGAKEAWYRSHESKHLGDFHWSVGYPTNNPTFNPIPMSERTRNLIDCNVRATGSWTDSNGFDWSVYFLRWDPMSIENVLRARIHNPERCLPASGLKEISDLGVRDFPANGLELPFRQYVYAADGKTLYVFFCLWEDSAERQQGMWRMVAGTSLDRIRSVLDGRRKLGQQTMEVIMTGPPNQAAAAQALSAELPSLIRTDNQRHLGTGQAKT